jgi:hypothetical protein
VALKFPEARKRKFALEEMSGTGCQKCPELSLGLMVHVVLHVSGEDFRKLMQKPILKCSRTSSKSPWGESWRRFQSIYLEGTGGDGGTLTLPADDSCAQPGRFLI